MTMNPETLRAWWFHHQGLDGSLAGQTPAAVLERTGWARSVAGASPYLGLRARLGLGRQQVDDAVARLEIHELPSARGCTYIVPASAFALALKLSQGFGPEADMRIARKLGVTDAEVDTLCAAVLAALAAGPLEPDELRAAIGDGVVRSLGEAGKKKGLSTTLPLALGRLQTQGEIRRVPVNGRLDQQRYRYTLWQPNPLAGFNLSAAECDAELARLFFRWIGPATFEELQTFTALGVKAAKAAAAELGLVPVAGESDGAGGERFVLPEQAEELAAFTMPDEPRYALVGTLDPLLSLRRDVDDLLAPEDAGRQGAGEKAPAALVGKAGLPNHAILDRGRVMGLWEYDSAAGEIVWISFVPPDADLRRHLAECEEYVRSDLGDVRSFSLDSPKSRVPRLQVLRALRDAT